MRKEGKSKIIGVAGTLLFHVLILLALTTVCLTYRPERENKAKWPPEHHSEILYGGEYVRAGDLLTEETAFDDDLAAADFEASSGEDLSDEGEIGEPSPPAAARDDSPMKVVDKPAAEKTGPREEELARIRREKREKEASERIGNQVKFGGKGQGSGESGSPRGNSSAGNVSGAPGHNLGGRTLEHWGKPVSQKSGTIMVKVTVNRDGKVIKAVATSGEGPAYADGAIRRNCEKASLSSRFSVDKSAAKEQQGTITWRFE